MRTHRELNVDALVQQLAALPNVVAVALGGSRARGEARPESDWDFGLYYRGDIDAGAVRKLGYPGEVVEPGQWGRLMNGGAWLEIEGHRVDLLYRDLDFVERWVAEAEAGRFEVDAVPGYLVGLPTYVLAGELSLNRALSGDLPRPAFPEVLRRSAPPWWYGNAAFSLKGAEDYAARGAVTGCTGSLVRALVAVAHARLAERGEWALNDKYIVSRAGLEDADAILTAPGADPRALSQTVARIRELTGLHAPRGLKFDEVVR